MKVNMLAQLKLFRIITFILIAILLSACYSPPMNNDMSAFVEQDIKPSATPQAVEVDNITNNKLPKARSKIQELPYAATPKPDPLPDLYGCDMSIEFISGPLKSQKSEFKVLDKSYFQEKGDKFAVGKGTAVYYEDQPYMILHSSYVNGNALKPMEAEFLRKYLEHWGNKDNQYIQGQIDALIGSQVNWYCSGEIILKTTINSAARLSHEASNRLWLEPRKITNILESKEGLASEWIGGITPTEQPSLYLGFCGWGPSSVESGRYTYYRYLLSFTVDTP
jgi:hypothetical protein